ncbi:MAG: nodulation protein NfeD [Anaerolineales bacterium]|jgi:membrane-bound serine protease (ClpP class)
MRTFRLIFLLTLASFLLVFQPVHASSGGNLQNDTPLVIVLDAEGAVAPAMQEYIQRGLGIAEQRNADLVILQLDTPGGNIDTMNNTVQEIRDSSIPVVVYVSPRGAMAASAGTMITLAGHASAMAPETIIGAASPVGGQGEDLGETMKAKEIEALKATVRTLASNRPSEAIALAESAIEEAKAASADEALEAGLVDFIAIDVDDLVSQLDGFEVHMADGPRILETTNATTEPVEASFIEQLLAMLTNPNVVFLLITIGAQAIFIELGSPGGWVAGFIGVVCLALAGYGLGWLPVNWFGIIFLITSFALFILDIKAPTHGALTAAGIGSFIVGALVLFNSPGTPQFQRVSVPLVVVVGLLIGALFGVLVGFGIRALKVPVRTGQESLVGKNGTATTAIKETGQVQVGSELWSAEAAEGSGKIRKGDRVEVVEVKGLRLKVRKL